MSCRRPAMLLGLSLILAATAHGQIDFDTSKLRQALIQVDTITKDIAEKKAVTTQQAPGKPAPPADTEKLNELRRSTIKMLVGAADHMERGTAALTGVESMLANQVSLTNATNPWSDTQLRNLYDEIKDFGSVLGSAVATLALARGNGTGQNHSTAAAGVGLLGLSQLVGRLFGTTNSPRLAEKAAFLDITVRAYDDMLAHKKHLLAIVDNNDKTRSPRFAKTHADMIALQAAAAEKLPNDTVLLQALDRVNGDTSEYETAIRELLGTSDTLQQLAGGYLLALNQIGGSQGAAAGVSAQASETNKTLAASKGASRAASDLAAVVNGLNEFKEKRAPAIYDFFNLNAETRDQLKNAETILRANAGG